MHPRLAEIIASLGAERANLEAAVASVPSAQWRERPSPDAWSVAEVLEHLVQVERRLTKGFSIWIAESKESGLAQETADATAEPVHDRTKIIDRSRRIIAGENVQPRGEMTVEEAWPALDKARAGLLAALQSGDGYALEAIVRPHPAFGPMNMYAWVAFVGAHMARHAEQIREIGTSAR